MCWSLLFSLINCVLFKPHNSLLKHSNCLLRCRWLAWENSRHLATLPRFPRQMTSEKRAQKFHTDDASVPRSGKSFWLVVPRRKFYSTNQKQYSDLCSDASSVWDSVLVSWTSFGGETGGSASKCRLFSQARRWQCRSKFIENFIKVNTYRSNTQGLSLTERKVPPL